MLVRGEGDEEAEQRKAEGVDDRADAAERGEHVPIVVVARHRRVGAQQPPLSEPHTVKRHERRLGERRVEHEQQPELQCARLGPRRHGEQPALALGQRALRGEPREQQHGGGAREREEQHGEQLVVRRELDVDDAAERVGGEDLEGEDRERVEVLLEEAWPRHRRQRREGVQHLEVREQDLADRAHRARPPAELRHARAHRGTAPPETLLHHAHDHEATEAAAAIELFLATSSVAARGAAQLQEDVRKREPEPKGAEQHVQRDRRRRVDLRADVARAVAQVVARQADAAERAAVADGAGARRTALAALAVRAEHRLQPLRRQPMHGVARDGEGGDDEDGSAERRFQIGTVQVGERGGGGGRGGVVVDDGGNHAHVASRVVEA